MRNYNSIFEVVNGFTGVLTASHTTAATALGNAIDTINFQDLLAVLTIGSLKGSGATDRACDLTVKLQECATINGTFTDITSGAINGTAVVMGSAKFDVVQVVAGSTISQTPFYQRKLYAILNQDAQLRYIRPHASVSGTSASTMQAAVSVSILLGKPRETRYITDAVSVSTTDVAVSYGFAGGSTPGM